MVYLKDLFCDLGYAIKRENFATPTSYEDVTACLCRKTIFTIVDTKDGFHKLYEKSSKLCNFNTPYGRISFTHFPIGISSAPKVFQKHWEKNSQKE